MKNGHAKRFLTSNNGGFHLPAKIVDLALLQVVAGKGVPAALFMVIAGGLRIANANWKIARNICAIALVTYIPMIWQRFNFSFGTDTGGLYFDIGIVVFMLIFIANKPNKSLKSGTPQSGAP